MGISQIPGRVAAGAFLLNSGLAKDVFMLGIAGSLILDSLVSGGRRKLRKARTK